MTKPVRLQLSRKKGFNLQKLSLETNGLPAVNVARPSRWGNKFKVGEAARIIVDGTGVHSEGELTAEDCVALYREWIMRAYDQWESTRQAIDEALRGKNLACYCPPGQACHASVLLELANKEAAGETDAFGAALL